MYSSKVLLQMSDILDCDAAREVLIAVHAQSSLPQLPLTMLTHILFFVFLLQSITTIYFQQEISIRGISCSLIYSSNKFVFLRRLLINLPLGSLAISTKKVLRTKRDVSVRKILLWIDLCVIDSWAAGDSGDEGSQQQRASPEDGWGGAVLQQERWGPAWLCSLPAAHTLH